MTMEDLFNTRQSLYYKKMSKYLKYVLNDHFVILLLFLGGATGLAYQNYLEAVQYDALVPRFLLLVIIGLTVFSGSIRTLVEPADAVFLLPKEKAFDRVMKKNLIYSLIFHSSYTLLIGGLAAPLLSAIGHMSSDGVVFWLMTLVCWKVIHGIHAYYSLKQHKSEISRNTRLIIGVVSLVGIMVSLFISILTGFIISVTTLGLFSLFVFQYNRSDSWSWEALIETEQRRIQKIYSIINLFIETPYSKHKVKRLKFLDFLYKLPVLDRNTEMYFLSRVFVRNYNFSGLYLRLLLIGSVVIYFSENWIIHTVISVLFLYLIGFQLIPLRQTFKKTVYFRLYPNTDTDKINTIKKLILLLLTGGSLVYSLAAVNSGILVLIRLLIFNGMFSLLFTYIYLPGRLKK
ncbi:ABC-2 type transport system permease protein [Alkalibacterium subtropicum]|uniref:ABC-2 type transport system permease protein n=1 Tax=Alkalibacterium subtropicum TaxID=753702 RepID=A0A1I1E8V6_9LACT|nr:ABC transporter permease [Alkalibacterium subtropicum]SFB83497.1 ABC-2 type transport system permease protein [Alkalibacterium subtropicum]